MRKNKKDSFVFGNNNSKDVSLEVLDREIAVVAGLRQTVYKLLENIQSLREEINSKE